jgi:small subunit ribosomal protein S1
MKQLGNDPWETRIPEKYKPGSIVMGKVTKVTNFGVFVELEEQLEGLLHVSELTDSKVGNPEELVKIGEEIEVKILRVDTADRKIGLSRKLDAPIEEEDAAPSESKAAPRELKGGMGDSSGPLFGTGTTEG